MTTLHHHHHHERPLHIIGVVICVMGLIALAFSAVLHDVPLAQGSSIFQLLGLSPADLNSLYGYHQYELIACIILSGLIVDVVGPRTITVMALFVAVLANYLFVHTQSAKWIVDSRMMVNFTHIFILTATLTLGTHWLPRRHFSLYVGFWSCVLITTPIIMRPYLLTIDSRDMLLTVFNYINVFGAVAIAVILLVAPVTDKTRHKHSLASLLEALRHYKVWLIALIAMIGWVCNTVALSFGSIYIVKHFNFDASIAFLLIKIASLSFAIGGIVMGLLSDVFNKRNAIIATSYFLAAISFTFLILMSSLSINAAAGVLFATTFFISSIVICYRKAYDYCTIGNSGVTMGFVLSFSLIGSRLLSPVFSHYLKKYAMLPLDGIGSQLPLLIIPALLLVGALAAAWLVKPVIKRTTVSLPIIKAKPN